MENPKSAIQENSLVTSQFSTSDSSAEEQTQFKSRYPPGFENIINRPKAELATKQLSNSQHSLHKSTIQSRQTIEKSTLTTQDNSSSIHRHRTSSVDGRPKSTRSPRSFGDNDNSSIAPTTRTSSSSSSKASTIYSVRDGHTKLQQILEDMYRTLREYFPNRIMLHMLEVPAFKHLRQAIHRLISTLKSLETWLECDDKADDHPQVISVSYLVRDTVGAVLERSSYILGWWNHREGGLKPGEPLTGKSWRLRRMAIHDSNEQLIQLCKLVTLAEKSVLKEQC